MLESARFTLCESSLRAQTRDVYGRQLSAGSWMFRIAHGDRAGMRVNIKRFDPSSARWRGVPIVDQATTAEATTGKFDLAYRQELKFIFESSDGNAEIDYRCELHRS